jgi:osmotically-inducible protein OsmY
VPANTRRAGIVFVMSRLWRGLDMSGNPPSHRPRKGLRQVGKTKDVREAVEAELSFDPLVEPADIAVRNLDGEVALNGTVPSYPQYLEAAAAAQRVAGVTSVYNHLEVVLPPRDYRDDVMLTTAANNALALNVTVPDGVEATARDGNLTLTGTVPYGSQRDAAEQAVGVLAGVRNVRDDIEIAYAADPVDIDLHVQEALGRSALVSDDSDVKVGTRGTTITLTGHVRTWAEHDAVVEAAWMADGVLEVLDDLYITG